MVSMVIMTLLSLWALIRVVILNVNDQGDDVINLYVTRLN